MPHPFPIATPEELIAQLNHCTGRELGQALKKASLDATSFEPFATWQKGTYTRNCLAKTNAYELLLLCWDVEAVTPIHCHDAQDCWVYALSGNLVEQRFDVDPVTDELVQTHTMNIKSGQMTFMTDDMGFHDLKNIGNSRAMTLHLYMNPIEKCRVYNETTEVFVQKQLHYDSDVSNYLMSSLEA